MAAASEGTDDSISAIIQSLEKCKITDLNSDHDITFGALRVPVAENRDTCTSYDKEAANMLSFLSADVLGATSVTKSTTIEPPLDELSQPLDESSPLLDEFLCFGNLAIELRLDILTLSLMSSATTRYLDLLPKKIPEGWGHRHQVQVARLRAR